MSEQKCPDCNHEHKKEDGTCTCGCQTQPPHKAPPSPEATDGHSMAGEGGKK